jgi:hypothetical protein
MPRFYLHIRSAEGLSKDIEGEVLPDVCAVHAVALNVVRRIQMSSAAWHKLSPLAQRAMAIEVANEDGDILLKVPFCSLDTRVH